MAASYSISDAVSTLQERHCTVKSDNSPIDVVAVVLNFSTLQSPPMSSVCVTPRADILVSDQSVPSDTTVKVSLYGSGEITRIRDEQIAAGDVVRFNGLKLNWRIHNSMQKNSSSGASNTDGSNVVINFEHPLEDPEPGWEWYKLGRIDVISGVFSSVDTSRRIPAGMATPDNRIQQLTTWFQRRGETGDIRSLSPLPCTRRSLAEIQSSVGLLSNINVRVTHCDSQVLPQSSSTKTGASKRKRTSQAHQQQVIGFATVTDSSGIIMSLVDPGNRFVSFFLTAKSSGKSLMLSNVSSKNQSDIYGRPLASEEIVLWPTRTTSASFLTQSGRSKKGGEIESSKIPGARSPTEEAEAATQSQLPGFANNQINMVSRIVNMSIRGRSVRECLDSPAELAAIVLTCDGDGYENASVKLDSNNLLVVGRTMTNEFLARAPIVRSLCGGLNPSELKRANNSSRTPDYHALELLRALFQEDIPLKWTIDVSVDPAEVTNVNLPRV